MTRHALPKGHTSILSPAFKYVPAGSTDLRSTFDRVRAQTAAADAQEREQKVKQINRRRP